MPTILRSLCLANLLAFCLLVAAAAQQGGPQVAVTSGTLQGFALPSLPHGGAFLAIPFAAPPVQNLRWKPPQPPPHWQGTRSATKPGPSCPQPYSPWLPEMSGIDALPTAEACLTLDVWTPSLNASARLPVFVWVHGGGNVQGATDWPPLGPALAEQGIVVVSINYRLGVLGFLASTSLAAESAHHVSGNYGHLDQIAALRWVRENIARFGGDPAHVTLGGQSSGSQDVCNLMASPLAAGLFQQAILHSGFCVDSVFPSVQSAQAKGERLAKDLHLPSGPAGLRAMRALPAGPILQAANADPALDLEPVIDGWVFPQQPAVVFQQGKQAEIAVLAGSNENEVSIFASPIVSGKSWRPDTIADYRQRLQTRFGTFAGEVFAQYPATSDTDARSAYEKMASEYFYGFGAWLMANETSRIGQKSFLYRFTFAGSGKFAPLGAFHSEELMFLSRKYWTSWVATPEDAAMSNAIVSYWTAFIKTGNPNSPGLPVWPAWHPDGQLQSLGRTIEPASVPRIQHFAVLQRRLAARLQQLQPSSPARNAVN